MCKSGCVTPVTLVLHRPAAHGQLLDIAPVDANTSHTPAYSALVRSAPVAGLQCRAPLLVMDVVRAAARHLSRTACVDTKVTK